MPEKQGETSREEIITTARSEVGRMKEAATLEIAYRKRQSDCSSSRRIRITFNPCSV